MPRVVSFIVLVAILLLVAAVFFQVMAHFVVPLFLAAVLVVVFEPLHTWVIRQIPGRHRIAALATTLLILLSVLLPTVWLGWKATAEFQALAAYLSKGQPIVVQDDADVPLDSPDQFKAEPDEVDSLEPEPESPPLYQSPPHDENGRRAQDQLLRQIVGRAPRPLKEAYATLSGQPFNEETLQPWIRRATAFIGPIAVSSLQFAFKTLFGLFIMVIALYYFLADGPRMLAAIMQMSPLDDEYERELLDKFINVSRAVVVASLASAVAQGLLAGIGYYFALNEGAPIFLLTMATMVLAIVPFAGAAAIWVPTAVWIYLYQGDPGQVIQGDPVAAIGLAIYGVCVVSAIDNVIKPFVLHGQSNLHPLVALMSILGGVQTLGPVGILVGPMLVAFIQALLNMVNKELHRMGHDQGPAIRGRRPAKTSTRADAVLEVAPTATAQDHAAEPTTSTPSAADKPPAPHRRRRRTRGKGK